MSGQLSRIAIVYSRKDPAATGTATKLLEAVKWEEITCPRNPCGCWNLLLEGISATMACYDESQLEFEFLDASPDPGAEAVIVLSKHSSSSGRPSLTIHYTGNPTGDNSMGGEPYTLSYSATLLGKVLLQAYRARAEKHGLIGEYEITMEATHHGPTNNRKPLVFIEIGSTEKEWSDPRAQEAMAETVLEVLRNPPSLDHCRVVAGFGGTHYPIKFTRIMLDSNECVGHVIPKYAFQKGVTKAVIKQALTKNWPRAAEIALVEKKSLKAKHRSLVEEVASDLGIPIEKI